MKTWKKLSVKWEDIIFEKRNKLYGAYSLRKEYPKNMSFAMCLASGIIFTFSILFRAPEKHYFDNVIVEENDTIILTEPRIVPPVIHNPPQVLQRVLGKNNFKVIKDTTENFPDEIQKQEVDKIGNEQAVSGDSEGSGNTTGREDGNAGSTSSGTGSKETEINEGAMATPDVMPMFGDSQADLMRYLAENLRYPRVAKENGIEGKVLLHFIVNANGLIENIKVIRPLEGGCSEEAIRVIKAMPPWKPGKFKGRHVAVSFYLPIHFTLL